MHKNATKCNKTLSKWCKNKHGASKIIDTFEAYHCPMDMAMEISLACLSAAAALFAASFFSLSALLCVSVCRCSTSAAHAAFVIPGDLSLGARGILAFGTPSSVILFGGMVVEEKRRSCNSGGF
jgi:hypothetical protein